VVGHILAIYDATVLFHDMDGWRKHHLSGKIINVPFHAPDKYIRNVLSNPIDRLGRCVMAELQQRCIEQMIESGENHPGTVLLTTLCGKAACRPYMHHIVDHKESAWTVFPSKSLFHQGVT